jgi:hypothetical protein
MHERDGAAATTVADDERPAAPTPGEAAAGRGDGAPLTPAQRRGLLAVLAVAAVVQWVIDHPGRELLQTAGAPTSCSATTMTPSSPPRA